MPVKKRTTKSADTGSTHQTNPTVGSWCYFNDICQKIFITLIGILLVYSIVYIATLIRNNIKQYDAIGLADKPERTIMIEAQGEVTAKPDIAMTNMGVISEGATVAEAQTSNTQVMNTLTTRLAQLGITGEDIQTTHYNISPLYNYTEQEGRVLTGYQVSQEVEIKIRDLSKAQAVLALAGEVGANNVSGLTFTVDDREVYKEEAREKAFMDVAKKARAISQSLGVHIVGIASYNEYEVSGGNGPIPYSAEAYGLGGSAQPKVEPGGMDVVMNVSVLFEIR